MSRYGGQFTLSTQLIVLEYPDRETDRGVDKQTDRQKDRWMIEQLDRQTDGWIETDWQKKWVRRMERLSVRRSDWWSDWQELAQLSNRKEKSFIFLFQVFLQVWQAELIMSANRFSQQWRQNFKRKQKILQLRYLGSFKLSQPVLIWWCGQLHCKMSRVCHVDHTIFFKVAIGN